MAFFSKEKNKEKSKLSDKAPQPFTKGNPLEDAVNSFNSKKQKTIKSKRRK